MINVEDVVLTNSLLKTWKTCPRQALYKHVEKIAPKYQTSKPLKRGTWFHYLLEARYGGRSVSQAHKEMIAEYGKLFDEEKEALGDLPREMADLYRGYKWHYRDDQSWTVHEVEMKLEADLPNGLQLQGKTDMLVEDEYGLWLVDHKTHNSLPRTNFRLLDTQSPLYIWMARQNDIPVQGFIWNYIVPKAPQPVKFTKAGALYKRQPHTDYPTALKSITEAGMLDEPECVAMLERLKQERYDRDMPQTSPVFRRDTMEKNDEMIERVVLDAAQSGERYIEYFQSLDNPDHTSRSVSRSCDWCSYAPLCIAELVGLDADGVRRREFVDSDPLAYYQEGKQ